MNDRNLFIELNYYHHDEFSTPTQVISKHRPSNLFAPFLAEKMDVTLVKHANYSGSHQQEGVNYEFFKSRNSFFHIPFATHRFIKKQNPDMILVQGLIFPLQVIALGIKLGRKCKIVLQHQGEPPSRRKKVFQKMADRYTDGYIFTSMGNAKEWIDAGIIKDRNKCYEIIPSSTTFTRQDKTISKQRTGMKAPVNFLWVGRLNANKDPLTVLAGFEKYFIDHPTHKLYLIYGDDDMLEQVKEMTGKSSVLSSRVELVGKVAHPELEYWYSAADYFVSGSHREGGSYALTEAMACGCIPIVTSIPSAIKVTGDGKAGHYFRAGDSTDLLEVLAGLAHERREQMSGLVQTHFKQNFSPAAIAEKIRELYTDLKTK
ncbi:MAG TPA: glycosyltransferase family 4 protein [Chitinophagaceae bacterium]|jgi:glycosyltransferase involved in cell wall biosynthesis|nr:glycosyltransferase family 4 protein [Chitinophagaceae bacterium]